MHSVMYSVVKRLYDNKKITEKYLDVAIELEWITEEEKQDILSNEGLQE